MLIKFIFNAVSLIVGLASISKTAQTFISESARRRRTPEIAGTSLLLAYYTEGTSLIPIEQGKIGNLNYTAMGVTGIPHDRNVKTHAALIYRVELPFNTALHLLGIPKRKDIIQLDPTKGGKMERAVLEGDYRNYFNLYCGKGMQTQTRYFFDPKAMVFTVDFCRSHNWEIIDNELYFLQAAGSHADDKTSMFDDITKFVHEIKPSVAIPLTDHDEALRTPYGQDRRQNIQCPVCASQLQNNGSYFLCPDGHGCLLTGVRLLQLRTGEVKIPGFDSVSFSSRQGEITCPSCGNLMQPVEYKGAKKELHLIDSCTNCPYRWLDRGEVV